MDKADKQPFRDKVCLARNHLVKKGAIGVRGTCRLWVMPRDDVISEAPDRPIRVSVALLRNTLDDFE